MSILYPRLANMTTLSQPQPPLPERCWDLDPATLRRLGAVDDYDFVAHAIAERQWDVGAGKKLAQQHGLAPIAEALVMARLRERHNAIWGEYSDA